MSVSQLNVLSHKIYLNLNVIWFYWIRHFGCLNKYFEFSSVWANRLLLMNFWYTIWYFAAILSFCYLLQNNYDLWSIYKPQERIKLLFFYCKLHFSGNDSFLIKNYFIFQTTFLKLHFWSSLIINTWIDIVSYWEFNLSIPIIECVSVQCSLLIFFFSGVVFHQTLAVVRKRSPNEIPSSNSHN